MRPRKLAGFKATLVILPTFCWIYGMIIYLAPKQPPP